MPRRLLSPQRLSWMLGFVSLAGLALAVRVAYIQCVGRGDYIKAAIEKPGTKLSARGTRGSIIDRSGRALVVTATTVTVACSPPTVQKWAVAPTGRKVKDLTRAEVRALPRITELARTITTYIPQAAETDILERLTRKTSYAVLARYAEADHAKRLRDRLGRTPGLAFTSSERRAYMNDTLASGVLGYCNTAQQPSEGLELWYRQITEPQTTPPDELYDRAGRRILGSTSARRPRPLPGKDLVLTLDYGTQQAAEQILDRCWATRSPKGANVIVLSPRDGAILAMASRPNYNPNLMNQHVPGRQRIEPDAFVNRVASHPMEPGSTEKLLTIAAGLEYGVITESSVFNCSGRMMFGGEPLSCWGEWGIRGHGALTPEGVLANSCNLCAAQIAQRIGRQRLLSFLGKCGLGELPRAGLHREQPGWLPTPAAMCARDLGNIGFGQGLMVSDLQLAAAVGAIMNDGLLYQPHIVQGYDDPVSMRGYRVRPKVLRRVCAPATSAIMRRMARKVVERGTGRVAALEGHAIGGKTATAQIADEEHGGYIDGEYLFGFLLVAPVDRTPDFVVLVSVERPKSGEHGSDVAGPLATEIARYLLRRPGLFPPPDAAVTAPAAADPDGLG